MNTQSAPTSQKAAAAVDSSTSRMLTKIVATIGPASESPDMVRRLINAGVSVFRFNFSHGDFDSHAKRLATVRAAAEELGRPIACLGDLQGPKIRIGKVPEGGLSVEPGQDVIFRAGLDVARIENGCAVFPTTYEKLIDEVEGGQRVLINDGAIRMLAVAPDREARELRCRVTIGGLVTSGKGINLPQSSISAPAITERDWQCVDWAFEHGMDFLALSFVRCADEVLALKRYLLSKCPAGSEHDQKFASCWIPVVAKIEKPQALVNLREIVAASDGIMVARGDLGVEMDIARVPVAQKEILAACAEAGKPCIVATQMLETMIENVSPTRAEASDVANAVFDGADAVMLSAETAAGKHPALVVETMRRIVCAAEARLAETGMTRRGPTCLPDTHRGTAALAHGAAQIASDLGAKAVVVWSQHGGTARYLSQNEMTIPIVAWSSDAVATRRMALLRGVTAVCQPPPPTGFLRDWNDQVDALLIERGFAKLGDPVILLAGRPLGTAKATNTIAIHRVGEPSGYSRH